MTLETLKKALKDMDEGRLPIGLDFREAIMVNSMYAEIERQRANGIEPVIEDQGNGRFGFSVYINKEKKEGQKEETKPDSEMQQ
jgi:hypothetical protein